MTFVLEQKIKNNNFALWPGKRESFFLPAEVVYDFGCKQTVLGGILV
jgi:hypothetical protein